MLKAHAPITMVVHREIKIYAFTLDLFFLQVEGFFISLNAHDRKGISRRVEVDGTVFETINRGCATNPFVHRKIERRANIHLFVHQSAMKDFPSF